jgi:hypothetical protein
LVLDPQPPIGHRGCAMQSAAKLNHWWIRWLEATLSKCRECKGWVWRAGG